jgi:NAD-dependent dihydropyrimidine dehydrogenase PreA subunit
MSIDRERRVVMVQIDRSICDGCGRCAETCPIELIIIEDGKANLSDPDSCMECGYCVTECPNQAIML